MDIQKALITLDKTTMLLTPFGGMGTIIATVEGIEGGMVTWTSSNPMSFPIMPMGNMITVYAMASSGSTTITATCEGCTPATCEVTIGSLVLDKNEITLTSGQMSTITATVEGTEGTINWTSSNTNVATLSSTIGDSVTVTEERTTGMSIITAECNGLSATCKVIILGNITDTNLQIGDYVNYTPTSGTYSVSADISGAESTQDFSTETNLQWRVLSKNGNQIELVSATPTANSSLTLSGANGFNYGVDILNELCNSCYSNSSIGVTARSMNIEDVNRLANYTPTTGDTYNYTGIQYPKILDNANYKTNESQGIINGTSNIEISGYNEGDISLTGTNYSYSYTNNRDLLLTGMVYVYWLASRSVNAYGEGVAFNLGNVTPMMSCVNAGCYDVFSSNGYTNSCSWSVRPVVTITL